MRIAPLYISREQNAVVPHVTILTTVTHITTLPVTVNHVLFTLANQEQSILAEIQGHTVVTGHPHQSTDRRGSRPQTPANYPPRQHDRSPIPAAPVSNNSSEVYFLLRMLQNMKSDFQRDLLDIRQSIHHHNNPRGFHLHLRHLHCIITSLLLQLTWTIPQSHRFIIKSTPEPLSGCRILLNSTAKRPVRESQRQVLV